jgi:prepilin peptidase CpaA
MPTASLVVLAIGLAAAVFTDVRTRRIPNMLTGMLAAAGLGLAVGGGIVTPLQAVLGMFAGLLLMMPGHLLGATGAGDVKLMAAVGAVVGPHLIVRVFLYTAVAGGLFALAVATRRGSLMTTLAGTGRLVTAPIAARPALESPSRANRFAYGPAIAVGTFVALLV